MAHPGSRVIALSHKDRSAILMGGRMADLALWWDTKTGAFVSSTWYAAALPQWAADFNAARPADAWLGREWRAAGEGGAVLGRMPDAPGPAYYGSVYGSPFGNELLVSLAERALEGERLGSREATDVLALSFSCNDSVGHDKGPHSAEIRDITVRTDLALDRLLAAVDRRVGLARTVVVLTADHGVAPVPEQMKAWKMPGGRLSRADLETARRRRRSRRPSAPAPGWRDEREAASTSTGRSWPSGASTPPPSSAAPRPGRRAWPRCGAPTPGARSWKAACPPTPGAVAFSSRSTASARATWRCSSSPTGCPRPRARPTAPPGRTTPTSR